MVVRPIAKIESATIYGMLNVVGDRIRFEARVKNTGIDGNIRIRAGIGYIEDGLIYYVKSTQSDAWLVPGSGFSYASTVEVTKRALLEQNGDIGDYTPRQIKFIFMAGYYDLVDLKWKYTDTKSYALLLYEKELPGGIERPEAPTSTNDDGTIPQTIYDWLQEHAGNNSGSTETGDIYGGYEGGENDNINKALVILLLGTAAFLIGGRFK